MSTCVEHPLETLYQAREALRDAVSAAQRQTPEQISDDLGCYAVVNTSILYEFRSLVGLLADKIRDTSHPTVCAAHGELRDVLTMFDMLIGYVQQHQPTIDDLQRGARRTDRTDVDAQPVVPHQPAPS
ncbi:hypothetical protein [Saccharopolyspora sp. NPDC002376]